MVKRYSLCKHGPRCSRYARGQCGFAHKLDEVCLPEQTLYAFRWVDDTHKEKGHPGIDFFLGQKYTYIYTYRHTYIRTHIHNYFYTFLLTDIHSYIHTYTHIYTYTYIQTYIHTYNYTHTQYYLHADTTLSTYLQTSIHTWSIFEEARVSTIDCACMLPRSAWV